MDEIAKKGYEEFKEYYLHVAKLYGLYGDNVLNVEFEGIEDEFKKEFKINANKESNSGLLLILKKRWMEKYQETKVIKSTKDISLLSSSHQEYIDSICTENIEKCPLREFHIDEKYFKKLVFYANKMKWNKEYIYIALQEVDSFIYIIEVQSLRYESKRNAIKILGCYPKDYINLEESD